MKKIYLGIGVGVLVIVAFAVFRGTSPTEFTAKIGGSLENGGAVNSSGSPEPSVSTGGVAIADSGSATTKSPTATTKSTTTPRPTATPTSAPSSGTGSTTGTGTTTTATTGTKEVVGVNNALSVKGTGTVFKLVTNGMTGLTVTLSSPATAEVIMSNMSFNINIISAPTLPMTFSFKTTAGKEHFVFKNDTSRYSLELVPASGLMEYTINAAPANFTFAAGFAHGTWNKNTPDPVNITIEKPPKSADTAIPGAMFWAYDIGIKYKASKGSLAGICASRELFPAIYEAKSDGKEYHCNESAGAFAVSVKLPASGKYVCVDSVGNKIGDTSDIGSATACK